jgi:uncharacterized protein YjiS (DUF1127 family)
MTHTEARLVAELAVRSTRSIFHRLLLNWHSRRRLANLRKMNDRLLQDIGLRRKDLDRVLGRRLTSDGCDELRRILLRRTD